MTSPKFPKFAQTDNLPLLCVSVFFAPNCRQDEEVQWCVLGPKSPNSKPPNPQPGTLHSDQKGTALEPLDKLSNSWPKP